MIRIAITLALLALFQVASSQTLIDSYATGTTEATIRGSVSCALGQSFTNSNACTLGSGKIKLRKQGSPTGSAYMQIYTHSGTYGTSSVPNTLIATSDALNVATLSTTASLVNFAFTGANQVSLSAGTYYVLAISYSGGNLTNNLRAYVNLAGTHSGNYSASSCVSWNYQTAYDLVFEIYTTAGATTQIKSITGVSQATMKAVNTTTKATIKKVTGVTN